MSDAEPPKSAHLEVARSSVRQALDLDEIGHGYLVGVLRPEYGDEHGEVQCDNCGAGWVGRIGEECGWCVRAVNRAVVDSRLSELEGIKSVLAVADNDPLARYKEQKIDWPSFYADDHAGEEWLAEPLIPAGRLVAMYAPAKQGKSEVALAVVAAFATGRPILGRANAEGRRHIIYLDYEMTRSDLFERLNLLGYPDPDEMDHLHYWSLPDLPPLDTPEGCAVIRGLAAEYEAEAVVIDTMGRAVEGDENSNDTYRDFARLTGLGLKHDGVAVVRTDHAGKDKDKGQRGASAKNDDADVVFRVDRVDAGWKLTRTHTRINWVPEETLIDRTERTDANDHVTLKIGLSPRSTSYPDGTSKYVKELREAGITVNADTIRKDFVAAVRAEGLGKADTTMTNAYKYMLNSLPTFTGGPTPIKPTDSCLSADPDTELDDVR